MYLSHFETHLKFSKTHMVATPSLSIYRALSGRASPKSDRPREPGVRIRDEERKSLVVWDYDSCSIIFEDRQEHNSCITNTVELLDKIDKIAPMLELETRGLKVDWVLPVVNYDFKSLEQKYREHFFKQYPIFDNCVDSGVVMDMRRNNWSFHHESGPMNIAQLRSDFRAFPMAETKDKLFLFLDSVVESSEKIRYSNKQMKEFLDGAFKMCENHSVLFQGMMEGIL